LRSADAPPLAIISSLAYFAHVIDEVLSLPVSPEYFRHLRQRIATFPSPSSFLLSDRIHACGVDDADCSLNPQATCTRLRRG